MAYLDNNTTLSKTLTLNKASGTVVTLNTGNTYLNKNIELTLNIQNENPSFSGGDITGTATASSNSCSISSSTNNSGIELIAAASASRSAINYPDNESRYCRLLQDAARPEGMALRLVFTRRAETVERH